MNIQDTVRYLEIIRKWWWVTILLCGVTVGTMLMIALLTEPKYEAKVILQVSAPPPQEVPLYSEFGRQVLNDEIAQTQNSLSEFLKEGNTAWRALDKLPDISMEGEELREEIIIIIPENSQLMRIGMQDSNPETAALLANTIVEVGLQLYGELRARPTANTRMFIEGELMAVREELKTAEMELTQFQINNRIGSLEQAINKQYDLIRSLKLQRDLTLAKGETPEALAIEEIILDRETELQDMIGLSAEYNELDEHVKRTRATANFLLNKKSEAQIKENQILNLDSIQIITPAHIPQKAVTVVDSKYIVLGAVVSIMAGVLLSFFLEYLEVSGKTWEKKREQPKVVALHDSVG